MNRRTFLKTTTQTGLTALFAHSRLRAVDEKTRSGTHGLTADLTIAGGGLGGCAAALAALRAGLKVILTEETDWLGGQLTQQGVPPDEHRWIESHGCTHSYRQLRHAIRQYYRDHYPLTDTARTQIHLNPGGGLVSRLCHEPRVALAVLENLLAQFLSTRQLILLLEHKITAAQTDRPFVRSLLARSLTSGRELVLESPFFIDATELGDLLPLTGTEFLTGAESQADTAEPHAALQADPDNQQAFTSCFAVDHLPGQDHTIPKPAEYDFWRAFTPKLRPPWPGKLLDFTYTHPPSGQPRRLGFNPEADAPGSPVNLWLYRRIANKSLFNPGTYPSDICLVNWPQNDYFLGNLVGVPEQTRQLHVHQSKQLSLSLLYWLQTEAPTPDGKTGFPGLRLRPDILGTEDGLAKYPYVREARRIRALFTILEQHVSTSARAALTGKKPGEVAAAEFPDSVGIGSYPIDLHPTTTGDNYIDFPSLPFQIPLGSLIPIRMENLLPAAKNIGTTHVTNGCYRLHPVEWNIGEAAGALAAFALRKKCSPRKVRERQDLLDEFQASLRQQGIETQWPLQKAAEAE